MRRIYALGLSALTVAALIVALSAVTAKSVASPVLSVSKKGSPSTPRLVSLEVKMLEVSEIAMQQADMRLNSIGPEGADATFSQKAIGLLDDPAARAGVRLVADLAYAIPILESVRFTSGLKSPTQTTTIAANGVAQQAFAGFQESIVETRFTVRPVDDRILVNVAYETNRPLGGTSAGLPPSRSSRSGQFAAIVPDGEMRVFGGMIRNESDSDYVLFFIKPRWID